MVVKRHDDDKTYASGMDREISATKPRFDLTVPLGMPYERQMWTQFAYHMAAGAEKYSERNWEKANSQNELDRFTEATWRHFMQYMTGEVDEDHLSALLFNLQGIEYTKWRMKQ